MLLLTKREELIRSLPPNSNFYCRMLIEKYNPVHSLAYYSAKLDIPIEEVKFSKCRYYLFLFYHLNSAPCKLLFIIIIFIQ